jgi:phosphoglycolate phosphatase-like HAD superfamily hydrolase
LVRNVTEPGPEHVPAAARVAVFDNDGTLWPEQPLYIQLAFALDRVKALAPQHPEWRTTQPFKGLHEGRLRSAGSWRTEGAARRSDRDPHRDDQRRVRWRRQDVVRDRPALTLDRPYTELVYQPMTELLALLRDSGFNTYIVSGGGIEFMRAIAERLYGIPPEQIIGSSGKTRFELRDGVPVVVRLPELDFFDDKGDKVVAIQNFIGRRPNPRGREFRRRPADAPVDCGQPWRELDAAGRSH